MRIRKITVIGAGLIGGSIIKALARFSELEISCIDRDNENLNLVVMDGIKIETFDNIEKGVRDADLIFICTPVTKVLEVVERIAHHVKEGAVLTDVGSTKGWLVDRINDIIPHGVYFIGGHPMTGSEKPGYKNSRAEILKGANYILIDDDNIPCTIFEEVKNIICMMGAFPVIMDKKHHDCSVAAVSHLPYITSVCLSRTVGRTSDESAMEISAGSLRDMTRVSASSINMWRDICITNKEEIKRAISGFREEIDMFAKVLEEGNEEEIENYLLKAKEFRDKLAIIKKL